MDSTRVKPSVYRLAAIQSVVALSDGLVMDTDVPLELARELLYIAQLLRSRLTSSISPTSSRSSMSEAMGTEGRYTPKEAARRLLSLAEELESYQVPAEMRAELESLGERFTKHLQGLPAFWDSYRDFIARMCNVC